MRHLFYKDDLASFIRDLAHEQLIGPVPYNHREQWSDSTAPLRLEFRTADPMRHGLGLSLGSTSESQGSLIKDGFLPPDHMCISAHVGWLSALTVVISAEKQGILAATLTKTVSS